MEIKMVKFCKVKFSKKEISTMVITLLIVIGAIFAMSAMTDKDFENVKATSTMVEARVTKIKKEHYSYNTSKGSRTTISYAAWADFTAPDGTVYMDKKIGAVAERTRVGDTVDLYINNATGEFYICDKRGAQWHTGYSLSKEDGSSKKTSAEW